MMLLSQKMALRAAFFVTNLRIDTEADNYFKIVSVNIIKSTVKTVMFSWQELTISTLTFGRSQWKCNSMLSPRCFFIF